MFCSKASQCYSPAGQRGQRRKSGQKRRGTKIGLAYQVSQTPTHNAEFQFIQRYMLGWGIVHVINSPECRPPFHQSRTWKQVSRVERQMAFRPGVELKLLWFIMNGRKLEISEVAVLRENFHKARLRCPRLGRLVGV
jgi:hypothetical protein